MNQPGIVPDETSLNKQIAHRCSNDQPPHQQMFDDLRAEDLYPEKAPFSQEKDFSFIQNKRVPSPLNTDYANLSAENQSRSNHYGHIRNTSESHGGCQSGGVPVPRIMDTRVSHDQGTMPPANAMHKVLLLAEDHPMLNPTGQSTDTKGGPVRTDFDAVMGGNASECGKSEHVNFFKNGGEII